MNTKFIKVFSEKDRDYLLKKGYILVEDDIRNSVFTLCFNDAELIFELSKIEYIVSNTLSF